MKWFVVASVILLIPVLMITCKKPDITGTWLDTVGIEQRTLKRGSGITLSKDGVFVQSYQTTNGESTETKGKYFFEDGRLFIAEEEMYTIDSDGVRMDHSPKNWSADIEFVTANEIIMSHPTQGKIAFRREGR